MANFLKQGAFFLLLALVVFFIFLFSSRDPSMVKMLAFPIAIFLFLAILTSWLVSIGVKHILQKTQRGKNSEYTINETETQLLYKLISTRMGRPWMIEELAVVLKKSEEDIQDLIDFGKRTRMLKTEWQLHPMTDEEYLSIQFSKQGLRQFKIEKSKDQQNSFPYKLLEPVARSTYPSQLSHKQTETQDYSPPTQILQETVSIPRRGLKSRRPPIMLSKEQKSND